VFEQRVQFQRTFRNLSDERDETMFVNYIDELAQELDEMNDQDVIDA